MKSETTSYERERILKEDAIMSYHIFVISIKMTELRKTAYRKIFKGSTEDVCGIRQKLFYKTA